MNRVFKVILFLGLLSAIPFLFLFALEIYGNYCVSQEERWQNIVASDTDCAMPCWRGIMPGISTTAEVDELVKLRKPWALRYVWLEKDSHSYSWNDMHFNFTMALGIDKTDDSTIEYISFHENSDTHTAINLNVITDSLGLPDTYGARFIPHVHYTGGLVYYTVALFYEEQGVVVRFSIPNDDPAFDSCKITLAPGTVVDNVKLTQPPISQQEVEETFRGFGGRVPIHDWDNSWIIEAEPCHPY